MKLHLDLSSLSSEEEAIAANDPAFSASVEVPSLNELEEEYRDDYSEESFWDKCKNYASSIGREGLESALLLYYAAQSDKLDTKDKVIIYGTLGYLISFIDAIPDLTPVFGYTDDIALIALAAKSLYDVIDEDVKAQARETTASLLD